MKRASTTSHRTASMAMGFALVLALSGIPALADGGGGGGSGGDGTVKCREGMTYDKNSQRCVHASLLDDGQLYEQGRALALAGNYENALDALRAVRKPDAMTITMIGYSKRKMGRVEEGIADYFRALAIEPDNIHTREYLGEGYVALDRIDLAKAELVRIEAVCGRDCEQYRDLAAAIAGEPEGWHTN